MKNKMKELGRSSTTITLRKLKIKWRNLADHQHIMIMAHYTFYIKKIILLLNKNIRIFSPFLDMTGNHHMHDSKQQKQTTWIQLAPPTWFFISVLARFVELCEWLTQNKWMMWIVELWFDTKWDSNKLNKHKMLLH